MDFSKLLTVFIVSILLVGCGETSEEETESIQATLSSIQSDVFTPTCARSSCHSAGSASGGLVLEAGSSFANLVSTASTEDGSLKRVTAGDPDNSYLVKKIEGTATANTSRMPLGGSKLSDEEIQAIRDWITAGAENN